MCRIQICYYNFFERTITPMVTRALLVWERISDMNSNDLFSFLDEPQEGNDSDYEHMDVETVPPTVDKLHKRKVDTSLGVDEENVSTTKKQRLSSPKPVVLDDFETEAKREVAASAGLTGAAETESRLELKHQVLSRKLTYR